LFRREFAGPTTAGRIAQYAFDSTRQSRCFLAALDQRQPLEGPDPTATPNADGMPFTAEFFGDGFVVLALKGQKNHAGSLGHSLRACAGLCHEPQSRLLSFRDDQLGCFPWHARFSRSP
jgi:hypothetical protein